MCGRESEVGLFCSECYLKKNLKIELPSLIELQYCRSCQSYLLGGKWVKDLQEEEAVLRATDSAMKTNVKRLDKAGVLQIRVEEATKEYHVTVAFVLGDSEVKKKTIVRIKKVTCPDCSRMVGGYFEAVLQMRGGVSKDIVENIVSQVEKHKDRLSFVGEVKRVQGGYDVYLGSKKSAEKIVKGFRGQAKIKKSFKQVGLDRQSGKSKNRFYYLIRL